MSSKSRKQSCDDMSDESEDKKMPAVIKISDTVNKPKVGLQLDCLDEDFLWSPAKIISFSAISVTLHYIGWPNSYDERVSWKSERLAPKFAFTKQIKCLVNIMTKPKTKPKAEELEALPPGARKTYSDLWPCTVSLRMPHPVVGGLDDEDNCLYAEEFLRAEANIFVQPYATHLLPQHIQASNEHDGGRWLNAKRLRPWTDEPSKLGVLPKNFMEAFNIATSDATTVGVLPSGSAFEKGSLLDASYRVHVRTGSVSRDGSLQQRSELPKRLQVDVSEPPPDVVEFQTQVEEMPEERHNMRRGAVPPPSLPPPIEITDLIYPECGIKRCNMTNQWTASVCLGSNSLFLGRFPTQTQAYQATRIAAGENVEIETDLHKAQLADLRAVPIESIIEATERDYNSSEHSFSMHRYCMEKIRYESYQRELKAKEQSQETGSESQPSQEAVSEAPRKNKRKGKPRKVDLVKRCYIDS